MMVQDTHLENLKVTCGLVKILFQVKWLIYKFKIIITR